MLFLRGIARIMAEGKRGRGDIHWEMIKNNNNVLTAFYENHGKYMNQQTNQ